MQQTALFLSAPPCHMQPLGAAPALLGPGIWLLAYRLAVPTVATQYWYGTAYMEFSSVPTASHKCSLPSHRNRFTTVRQLAAHLKVRSSPLGHVLCLSRPKTSKTPSSGPHCASAACACYVAAAGPARPRLEEYREALGCGTRPSFPGDICGGLTLGTTSELRILACITGESTETSNSSPD